MLGVAFAIVYLGYGLNYLAIRVADKTLPPMLFAGTHVTLASLLLFTWLVMRRESLGLTRTGFGWAFFTGIVIFVGGTGLVSMAEKSVNSSMASILRASTPVWVALIEWSRPRGEKLLGLAWAGLFLALGGVAFLVVPQMETAKMAAEEGLVLVLVSALAWALGAILLRHHRPASSNVLSTAYLMLFGGLGMLAVGLILGEAEILGEKDFTEPAVVAFFFLLFFHSLLAFSALNWLLQHVSAPMATTKFYVTPAVALAAGCLVLGEPLHWGMLGGLALILAGVVMILWKH